MAIKHKVDTLIFDLDGTLADTLPDLSKAVNYALDIFGFKTWPKDEYRHFLGNGSKVLITKALGNNFSEENLHKVFEVYIKYYDEHVADLTKPFPHMKETLTLLKSKGYKLFCLTNKPQEAADRLIHIVFGDLFTFVMGNSKDIPTKPDPKGIHILMSKYDLHSENIAYFGDSDVDMILSDNAHLKYKIACGYGYRPLEELKKASPSFIIDDPIEILSLPFIQESIN